MLGRRAFGTRPQSDSVSYYRMKKGGPNDGDPVLDLREILVEDDEPLLSGEVSGEIESTAAASPPPVPKAQPSGPESYFRQS